MRPQNAIFNYSTNSDICQPNKGKPSLAANFQPALNQDESNYQPAKIAPLPLMISTFSTRTKTLSCLPLPALEGVGVPGSSRRRLLSAPSLTLPIFLICYRRTAKLPQLSPPFRINCFKISPGLRSQVSICSYIKPSEFSLYVE